MVEDRFWELAHLSDRALLTSLRGVLGTHRRALAEVIAHLAEVEERRLHLEEACSSLFAYCVQRLGMSEDEACRRITLARLARRFPLLFGELASGRIGLSVALLLQPVLTADNHAMLIAAVRGASLQQARELLASRFPKRDVPSQIRKLPERVRSAPDAVTQAEFAPAAQRPAPAASPAVVLPAVDCERPGSSLQPAMTSHRAGVGTGHTPAAPGAPVAPAVPVAPARQQRIEPSSAGRYRVQFTADASLKSKLERARDLLRHTYPAGDFADIVGRALDLLLDDVMKRRFGARSTMGQRTARSESSHNSLARHSGTASELNVEAAGSQMASSQAGVAQAAQGAASRDGPQSAVPAREAVSCHGPQSAVPAREREAVSCREPRCDVAAGCAPSNNGAAAAERVLAAQACPPSSPRPKHIPRATRRAVLARDGLGCSWQDASGQRCGSTAWLELDHLEPAGKGGSSAPENLRWLCRAHNFRAAERAYGRRHVELAIALQRRGGGEARTEQARTEQARTGQARTGQARTGQARAGR